MFATAITASTWSRPAPTPHPHSRDTSPRLSTVHNGQDHARSRPAPDSRGVIASTSCRAATRPWTANRPDNASGPRSVHDCGSEIRRLPPSSSHTNTRPPFNRAENNTGKTRPTNGRKGCVTTNESEEELLRRALYSSCPRRTGQSPRPRHGSPPRQGRVTGSHCPRRCACPRRASPKTGSLISAPSGAVSRSEPAAASVDQAVRVAAARRACQRTDPTARPGMRRPR